MPQPCERVAFSRAGSLRSPLFSGIRDSVGFIHTLYVSVAPGISVPIRSACEYEPRGRDTITPGGTRITESAQRCGRVQSRLQVVHRPCA
jgi:hypothetical protein